MPMNTSQCPSPGLEPRLLDLESGAQTMRPPHCSVFISQCYFYPQPERFVNLGIEPPKGVLLFGPPGTGKTLCARAVANRTDACFIRVIGSELVQKYVGEVSGYFGIILL